MIDLSFALSEKAGIPVTEVLQQDIDTIGLLVKYFLFKAEAEPQQEISNNNKSNPGGRRDDGFWDF